MPETMELWFTKGKQNHGTLPKTMKLWLPMEKIWYYAKIIEIIDQLKL